LQAEMRRHRIEIQVPDEDRLTADGDRQFGGRGGLLST
jgi:hypothetical protein